MQELLLSKIENEQSPFRRWTLTRYFKGEENGEIHENYIPVCGMSFRRAGVEEN